MGSLSGDGDGASCGVGAGEVCVFCFFLESVRAGVETQVRELGVRVAALRGVAVVEVLQVHEPLGPEAAADTLTVHGQVDQLAWTGQRTESVRCSENSSHSY